jgi:hypothetical protein
MKAFLVYLNSYRKFNHIRRDGQRLMPFFVVLQPNFCKQKVEQTRGIAKEKLGAADKVRGDVRHR